MTKGKELLIYLSWVMMSIPRTLSVSVCSWPNHPVQGLVYSLHLPAAFEREPYRGRTLSLPPTLFSRTAFCQARHVWAAMPSSVFEGSDKLKQFCLVILICPGSTELTDMVTTTTEALDYWYKVYIIENILTH